MNKQLIKTQLDFKNISFNVPSIGVGRMVPTTTLILLLLATLEEDQYDRVSIISSVCEHVGITDQDLRIYNEASKNLLKNLDSKRTEKYSWED